jgi:hypothetical protein
MDSQSPAETIWCMTKEQQIAEEVTNKILGRSIVESFQEMIRKMRQDDMEREYTMLIDKKAKEDLYAAIKEQMKCLKKNKK